MVHELTIAENGAQAVEKFQSRPFDLVLMDKQMPVMDGYTAAAKIREWENQTGQKSTPIIALTADDSIQDRQEALAAGCDSHLSKPVTKKD